VRSIPEITVGMPVYNGEAYVEEAIRSVLNQTFGDFELVISDNASDDRTGEICQDLASTDNRIRYSRNPKNIGAARNYSRVFSEVAGPYFRWANADDVSEPELHERCINLLRQEPEVVLAYGGTMLIDAQGASIRDYRDNLNLRQATPYQRLRALLAQLGMTNVIYGLMRSTAVRSTRLMGDGTIPAADILFMADLCLLGHFAEIPQQLFRRRIHDKASSWDASPEVQKKFWNAGSNDFYRPVLRSHMHLLGSVAQAPIPAREKLRLYPFLMRRMYWTRGVLLRELVSG
jgi:glycosyltransferase involved in cell wall biosynthesis